MSVNQSQRAFDAWPILVERATSGKTITYKQLGDAIGIHHRTVRYVLILIQDFCMEEKLPPLTILIVNQTGKPGDGFIAWDADNFDEGFQKVTKYNWLEVENPFSFASNGQRYEELIEELVNNPDESEGVYAKVKTRGIAQSMFRDAMLKAYKNKCAFTKLSFVNGLQAAHIIPWSKSSKSERLDIRNGILLNNFHHALFDNGIVTITEDYNILFFDPEMDDVVYSQFDKLLTVDLHMIEMNLPKKQEHWPLPEYIKRHHDIHEWDECLPNRSN